MSEIKRDWKPTMELKWVRIEIVTEGKNAFGEIWATMTGKYEKVLHQKFISDDGHKEWREIPCE